MQERSRSKVLAQKRFVACIGCGMVGTILCPYCRELNHAFRAKVEKLRTTIEQRFAMRERL